MWSQNYRSSAIRGKYWIRNISSGHQYDVIQKVKTKPPREDDRETNEETRGEANKAEARD